MSHELPPLPYPKDALEPFMDTLTMEIHHGKHHATYVANLNKALAGHTALQGRTLEALLSDLNAVPDSVRTAVRNNGGGHLNHVWFWQQMAPKAGGIPNGLLGRDLTETFGSFDTFKEKFEAAGLGRLGSGWVWLMVNKAGNLEITSTANQDNPLMDGSGTPILCCDVWEHAYYLKYQNRRGEFLKAWWNLVNWGEAAKNYASLKG